MAKTRGFLCATGLIWGLCGCRPGIGGDPDSSVAVDSAPASVDSGRVVDTAMAGTFDLVSPSGFVVLDEVSDPFADHRPPSPNCDASALVEETGTLEVDTGLCDYVSAGQAALAGVGVGDRIELLVYHASLSFDEPAEAHVAVAFDGTTVWETTVEIPSASAIYGVDFESPVAITVGDPVVFHLHNHGTNTWNLGHIRVTR